MLRQTAIIKAVVVLLKSKYANYPIYTDEIVEGFKQPCFFVKIIKRTDTEKLDFNSNALSIIITYFASTERNREIEYLDMTDDLNLIFGIGFKSGDRYLHIKSFTADRIGEKQDVLQIIITIEYLDDTNRKDPNEGYEMMQVLNANTKLV